MVVVPRDEMVRCLLNSCLIIVASYIVLLFLAESFF